MTQKYTEQKTTSKCSQEIQVCSPRFPLSNKLGRANLGYGSTVKRIIIDLAHK